MNIVLMSNEAGVPGVAVTVRSVLNKCTDVCNVYILSSNLSDYSKKRLRESWNVSTVGSIHFIDIDKKMVECFRPLLHLHHKETYLRLFISELLPESLNRCIVMGLDMIVTDDLAKIERVDLGDYIIAAALDISVGKKEAQEYRRDLLGLKSPEHYFNGDLLLVDLKKWREQNIGKKLQVFARENYDKTYAADQDPLNIILENKWLMLEQRWNLSQYSPDIKLNHKGIIHLIGPSKPWHADYNYKFKQHFFEILDQTAFKGTRPQKFLGLAIIYRKIYHVTPTPEIFRRKLMKTVKGLISKYSLR